jgi:hypothetical protein
MATQEEAKAQAKQFAKDLIKRSRDFADEFTEEIYGDAPRPMQGEALISLLRTNMWREYMLGCQAPAKLMTLIPDEHVDLKYLLAGQVADEMGHSQTFKARVEQLGGDGNLLHYEPTEEDWQLYYSTVDFDDPAELVSSLNCTGEVVLQQTLKRLAERRKGQPAVFDDETADIIEREIVYEVEDEELSSVVDEETARALQENVIPDEGEHVKIGRLILERFATTTEIQARCEEIQKRKFEALTASHGRAMAEARKFFDS